MVVPGSVGTSGLGFEAPHPLSRYLWPPGCGLVILLAANGRLCGPQHLGREWGIGKDHNFSPAFSDAVPHLVPL